MIEHLVLHLIPGNTKCFDPWPPMVVNINNLFDQIFKELGKNKVERPTLNIISTIP